MDHPRPDPVADDVTVTHPLAPGLGFNLRLAKEAAADKEKQKTTKYARLSTEKISSTSSRLRRRLLALGPQATQFTDNAADFHSTKCAVDRGLCRKQLVERVQVALLQKIGKRLLAGIQADEDWRSRTVSVVAL